MRAEAAGDCGPWRQQAILGRGRWDADALRDMVRDYALETLADNAAVLVIDETGFLKQGKASCGVARQYTGSAGKITNCQIGVFGSYVSRRGHAFIDRALYLPQAWTDDPARLKAAHVPKGVGFAIKPQIARRMIASAIAAIETVLRKAGQGLRAGYRLQSCVPLLGQEAIGRRNRREHRAKSAQECLAAPIRGRGYQIASNCGSDANSMGIKARQSVWPEEDRAWRVRTSGA